MLRYFLTRLARVIPVLLIVTFIITILLEVIPGNPAEAALGLGTTPEALAAKEEQLGLNDPIPVRYLKWLGNAVTGDLGSSMINEGETVSEVILQRLPVSIEIALVAQVLAVGFALIFGTWSAARSGSRFDRSVMAVTSAMQSIPSFCYALIFIVLFAVQRRWFPVTGWTALTENPIKNLKSVILPATSLALVEAAAYTRILRTDVVTTLNEDFIMSARAKGVPDRRILFRHALRPSSFGLVTLGGLTLARLIGGTVVMEGIFAIPGLGQKIINSLGVRDYTMIQGLAAFLAIVYVFLSVVVELIYALLDPRIRARVTSAT